MPSPTPSRWTADIPRYPLATIVMNRSLRASCCSPWIQRENWEFETHMVHNAVADHAAAFALDARRGALGEPAARVSGCPPGPDSRLYSQQPPLYRTVRLVDAAE